MSESYITINDEDIFLNEIKTTDDLEWLEDLEHEIDKNTQHMKNQLEFRTSDNADEIWEGKTIRALSIYQTFLGKVRTRIKDLQRPSEGDIDALTKAQNRANNLKDEELAKERKVQKIQASKVASVNEVLRTLNQGSMHRAFFKVARDNLSKERFEELEQKAEQYAQERGFTALSEAGLLAIMRDKTSE